MQSLVLESSCIKVPALLRCLAAKPLTDRSQAGWPKGVNTTVLCDTHIAADAPTSRQLLPALQPWGDARCAYIHAHRALR